MIECRRVTYGVSGEVTWVRFLQRHISDPLEIETLGERLYQLLDERPPRFVLDFAEVEYLSSAAFGKLISLNSRAKDRKGQIVFCNIQPELLRIFHICHLERIFNIRNDDTDALACFSP